MYVWLASLACNSFLKGNAEGFYTFTFQRKQSYLHFRELLVLVSPVEELMLLFWSAFFRHIKLYKSCQIEQKAEFSCSFKRTVHCKRLIFPVFFKVKLHPSSELLFLLSYYSLSTDSEYFLLLLIGKKVPLLHIFCVYFLDRTGKCLPCALHR